MLERLILDARQLKNDFDLIAINDSVTQKTK